MQGLFSRKKRVQGVQEAVPAKLQFGEGECTPGAVTVSVRVGEGAAVDGKGLDRIDRIDRIDDDDGPVDVAHGEPGGQEEEEGEEAPPSPSQRASVHRIYTVPPDTSTHLEPLDVDDMDDPLEVVLGLVAVGVPAVVWLAHLTGGGRVGGLSEERVREHLRHDDQLRRRR